VKVVSVSEGAAGCGVGVLGRTALRGDAPGHALSDPGTAADLAAAFEYLQQLRLRHQAGQLQAAAAPDNLFPLADLGALERRWLKDAFHLLHTYQEGVRIAFQTDLIA
jgi:CBS domain-containing protein